LKVELGAPLDDITAREATDDAHEDGSERPGVLIDADR